MSTRTGKSMRPQAGKPEGVARQVTTNAQVQRWERQVTLLTRWDALDLEKPFHAEFRSRAGLGPETLGDLKQGQVATGEALDRLSEALDWAEEEFARQGEQPNVGRTRRALEAARAALVEDRDRSQRAVEALDEVIQGLGRNSTL